MSHPITSLDGTPVSRFSFGAMQFGGRADARQSQAMFQSCRAAGITHFDTAFVYTDGESERLLGQFAAPERERLVIATKAAYARRATRDNIHSSLETSRKRLNMDVVDILYLHRFDPQTDLAETMEALSELRQTGLIRHVGLSNFSAWQAMKAVCVGARFDLPVTILQPMYNLVKRQAEVEILPMARSENLAVASYSPLGGGLLSGKYAGGGGAGRLREDERYAARYRLPQMHAAAEALSGIAAERAVHPATLAVAWVAAHPAAPMPIISARDTDQLAPSLAALDMTLEPEVYAELSALMPAPPPATDRLEEA